MSLNNALLLMSGDDGVTDSYKISNSLRFRSSASAYLNRTFTTPTAQNRWTYSTWVKPSLYYSATYGLFGLNSASDNNGMGFDGSNNSQFIWFGSGVNFIKTTQLFRDPSAWYHIVLAVDSAAAGTNKIRFYVNGVEVTSFSSDGRASFSSSNVNSASVHAIGRRQWDGTQYYDGYQAETYFVDGQQLTPSSFGAANSITGIWRPKAYTGTYGTNGFYLNFADNSALTTASNVGLGKDNSGNGNFLVTNNISITAGTTYDSMTDVPTLTSATVGNYCVMNPLTAGSVLVDGNLKSTDNDSRAYGSIGVSSGKWYFEVTCLSSNITLGIANDTSIQGTTLTGLLGYLSANGNKYNGPTASAYGASYTTNDVIGVAYDMDAGTLTFYKNNVSQGVAFTGITGTYYPAVANASSGSFAANFGQRPFTYTPPTGFVALNTFNLPDPTIGLTSDTQPNKYMDATLYTGTAAIQSITNAGAFRPDLVWIKSRSNATNNVLTDSVRGVTLALISNSSNAEATDGNGLTAFNSNGFTIGTNNTYNGSARTFVGWQWQAGSSTVTNTTGTISAQVRANPTAGFSIVTYTGNGTAGATVGHGLGVAPKMFIVKNRSNTGNDWSVWHTSISPASNFQVYLSTTAAQLNTWNVWNSTSPSSTTLTLGNDALVNGSTQTYVCYAWAEIAGFSKFGSYTGNGSTDGTFIYTGFRPKFVMIKRSDASNSWYVYDSQRNTYNTSKLIIFAESSSAEATSTTSDIDLLSNGFKIRGADSGINVGTYIYMAFAENPFKYALAR